MLLFLPSITVTGELYSSKPMYLTLRVYVPAGTPRNTNEPSAAETVYLLSLSNVRIAPGRYDPVSSRITPDRFPVPLVSSLSSLLLIKDSTAETFGL